MALTSYFLVVFHHEREEVQRAGWTYLVATHLGTAFLLALFGALAHQSGSLEFVDWRPPFQNHGALFALALVGFGTKAGLFPLHVWLPEAHPAAPSHVSALLSGAMIKTGIYGLLRVFAWMGSPPEPWALILIAIALVSGVLGVLSALAQRDLKRVLAYSSVENAGIIALGIGLAMVALDSRLAGIAALALAGSLLHVWNHALFKGLLFLAAGSIGRSAGTLELEQLGGLLRRMPWTGGVFVLGAAAICGLPPLNGFVGEFLIFLASFGSVGLGSGPVFPFLAGIAGLALVGGLSAACFARAAGIALLGQPRSEAAARATEAGLAMRAGMLPLAAGCLILGMAGPLGLAAAARAVAAVIGERQELGAMAAVVPALWQIGATGAAVVALALVFAALRRLLLRGREPRVDVTWDCGYAAPTSRMQYTASSFAEPLTRQFAPALGVELAERSPRGAFPGASAFESRVQDLAASRLFAPAFRAVAWLASRVRPLQSGSTHLYVLYVVLAALVLAIWRLG
jgi:formate hydrogenlyase subunit 3/multisubunit Na+/H+ antiporter MnhD subunit